MVAYERVVPDVVKQVGPLVLQIEERSLPGCRSKILRAQGALCLQHSIGPINGNDVVGQMLWLTMKARVQFK